jgi:hypothetical protein
LAFEEAKAVTLHIGMLLDPGLTQLDLTGPLELFGRIPGANVHLAAGIDFGLRIVAELAGDAAAKRAELLIQYDPAPPFRSGHPRVAAPALLEEVKQALAESVANRAARLRPGA